MTIDEELDALADAMRRLKVEYDMYFGGGVRRPPEDLEWRVSALIKKYSDTQKLNFGQRYRYNTLAQRHAIFSELWRQKLRIKEEGFRRPEQARLAIQGLRTEKERAAAKSLKPAKAPATYAVIGVHPEREMEKVQELFTALTEARRGAGEANPQGKLEDFAEFVKTKAAQIRRDYHCTRVEFRVEVHNQKVRLTAKAKKQ